MWHVLTSSKYTWSRKQIPEVEWDTQEEIPSLSPGLSYDQQCYQWFTGKLNYFMDTYPSSSAGQSNETTCSAVKWSLSERFMSNPTAFSVAQTDARKSRKHIIGRKCPLTNLNLVVEKLWSKVLRLKTRSWSPSMDQGIWHLWLWSPVPPKLSEKVRNRPGNNSGTVRV